MVLSNTDNSGRNQPKSENPGECNSRYSKEETWKVTPPFFALPRLTPLSHKPNYCGCLRVNWNEGM